MTLNQSSNVIGDSNNETNFQNRLLLTDAQVLRLWKVFPNNSSANVKLSKTQLSNMVQLGEFSGKLLAPLLKASLPLTKAVLKPLAKSVLIPLGLTTTDQQHQQHQQQIHLSKRKFLDEA